MKQYRSLILMIVIIFSAFVAYGLFTLPMPKGIHEEKFSSARVMKDLKVIAKEPHSVAHLEAKDKVLQYLTESLESLGGKTHTYIYPDTKARRFVFDAKNVLAEFPPLKASTDTTWLMMTAHYDSMYPRILLGDSTVSMGAADDGYGLGVILESVRQALKYRSEWNQGIKVLFTDGEEVDLQGIKAAYTKNKEIFDGVGFFINVEARGPFGPALLFETSPENERIMELYTNHANYPYTYSLTNIVYQKMPNGTDFTIVKDSIPGINFSTVADINHYHTGLDNLHNISEKTIQHYGEQITPIVKEYLTNSQYADKHYLMGENNSIYYSIPLLGMFNFSKSLYLLLNIGIICLFLDLFLKEKSLRWKAVLKQSSIFIGLSFISLLAGVFITWLCTLATGTRFRWFGIIQGIPFDNAAMIFSVLALTILMIRYFRLHTDILLNLYSSLFTLVLGSIVFYLIAWRENMMFFIPLCISTFSLMLWKTTSSRIFPLLGIAMILLHAFSFVYILSMALTIGALGIVLWLTFHYLIVIIPLAYAYLTDTVSVQTP